jgi:hypothetical protein
MQVGAAFRAMKVIKAITWLRIATLACRRCQLSL